MSGTKAGGIKAAKTNIDRHGKTFYSRIGQLGGAAGVGEDYQKGGRFASGFAADPEKARIVGAKGGKISRRGKKPNGKG